MVKLITPTVLSIVGIQGAEQIPTTDHLGLILQLVIAVVGLFHIRNHAKLLKNQVISNQNQQ
jgi:hypothetical protein